MSFRRLPGYRPRLERLEDRTLPSVNPILHLPVANVNLSSFVSSQHPTVPIVTQANPEGSAASLHGLTERADNPAALDISVRWQGTRAGVVEEIRSGPEERYSVSIEPYQKVDLAFKSGGIIQGILQVRGADGIEGNRQRRAGQGDRPGDRGSG